MASKPTHLPGAAAEHAAASWFLNNGYQVWWPSDQHDSADFVVSRHGRFYRVQVKKASWRRTSGRSEYLTCSSRAPRGKMYKHRAFHYLVAVAPDGIWMLPAGVARRHAALIFARRGPTIYKDTDKRLRMNFDRWRVL